MHTLRTVTWWTQNRHPSDSWKHWIRAKEQWSGNYTKVFCGLRSAPRRCQDLLEQILWKCGFVPNMLDTWLCLHTTKRVSRGRRKCWLERSLNWSETCGSKKKRSDDKTDALLGTNPGKDEGWVQLRRWSGVYGKHTGGVQHVRVQDLTNTARQASKEFTVWKLF